MTAENMAHIKQQTKLTTSLTYPYFRKSRKQPRIPLTTSCTTNKSPRNYAKSVQVLRNITNNNNINNNSNNNNNNEIIIITITKIIMITIKGIMPQKHHLIARAWQFGFAKEYIISAGDTFRPLKMKSCLFQTGKRSSLRTNERTNERKKKERKNETNRRKMEKIKKIK
jgi:hypothetical protein